jgi:hypothetical protein
LKDRAAIRPESMRFAASGDGGTAGADCRSLLAKSGPSDRRHP